MHVVVAGAGIFGVTAALALARRGRRVTLLDAGEPPHPLAASTDVSKAVRMDYGADEFYVAEMERALAQWREWNAAFGEDLFHESGAMFVSASPMAPGGFEHDSFVTLERRGHRVERLDAAAIAARTPLRGFVDGYFNPQGGWADSARVVDRLAASARAVGVSVATNARVARADREGVVLATGERVAADAVVVAAGSWTPSLVPEIAACFRIVAQPVFHLAAGDDVRLPVFGADLARTGWYGFPRRGAPRRSRGADDGGFVKIANHGAGRAMPPDSPDRVVTPSDEARLRAFLRASLPSLASAPLVATRACMYCDTRDGHFWIAPHPGAPNVVVAAGGSGHAFKFAPRLGDWIAGALDGDVVPRFGWRPPIASEVSNGSSERARSASAPRGGDGDAS